MLPCFFIHCFFCQKYSFHLCLPSKQTLTYLSKFSYALSFLWRVSRSLLATPQWNYHSHLWCTYHVTFSTRCTISFTSLLLHFHSTLSPFPPLSWLFQGQEMCHNYFRIPRISILPFSVCGRKKVERERFKEAKTENPMYLTKNVIHTNNIWAPWAEPL